MCRVFDAEVSDALRFLRTGPSYPVYWANDVVRHLLNEGLVEREYIGVTGLIGLPKIRLTEAGIRAGENAGENA